MTSTQTLWRPKVEDVCSFELEQPMRAKLGQPMEAEQRESAWQIFNKEYLQKLYSVRFSIYTFGTTY